jgi:hypothetical protein
VSPAGDPENMGEARRDRHGIRDHVELLEETVQEANDAVVSHDNPARATLNGQNILITSAKKAQVFD